MNVPAQQSIAYQAEQHYLFCDHCGAPVHFAPSSARAQCGHCRAPLELRMRPEAAAMPPRARSEDERLLILGSQERRFFPPRELIHLFVGERVPPDRERDAWAQFHALRAALQTRRDPGLSEQLFALGLALGELAIERGDGIALRALLDSVLFASSSPRHHQVMRALFARGALRAGLAAEAEAWLAACDARSEDLISDTAYRYARAYADSARGDWAAVVRVLHAGELPLSDIYAPECAVLCANAWEKLDQRATAVDVLIAAKRNLGPIAERRIRRFIDAHPGWNACAASEPEAERRVANMDALPAEGGALAVLIVAVVGVYSLLWGASAIGAMILLEQQGIEARFDQWSASLLGGGALGVLLLPFSLIAWLAERKESRKRTHYPACAAHVLSSQPVSGAAEGDESTLIALELLIVPDDAPAYTATLTTSVLTTMVANFSAGRLLIARVNPSDRTDFALEVVDSM